MKMEKLKRIIEYIKTAVIAILIVSAVCLFIVYMFEFQSISDSGAIKFDRMKMLSGYGSSSSYDLSSDCIFPSAFAYSCDGSRYLFTGSRSLYYTAYSETLNYLSLMYSSDSYCAKIVENADEVWNSCTERDFVYLLYQKPLPLPLLRLFSGYSDNAADVAQGELPYVREVFIMNGDTYLASAFSKASGISVSPASGDICAAVRDAKGGVYLIFCVSSHSDVKFDKALFSAYNRNDSVCAFTFFKDTDTSKKNSDISGTFSDTVIIPSNIRAFTDISVDRYDPASFSDAAVIGFLEDIGINTTKTRHYEGADGEITYISESFVFRISAEGVISYRATGDEGIPLSEILGYSKAAGNYSLFDSLIAAERFLSCAETDFGSTFFGGNLLSVLITECVYSEGDLRIGYDYGYNSIRLDGEKCVVLDIRNGSIVYAELHTVAASQESSSKKPEPAVWAIESAICSGVFDGEKTLYGLSITYVSDGSIRKAEWEVTVE